jgi:hypothetical protein
MEMDYSSLPVLQKIHDLLPKLSKTEQRVAAYILENFEKVTSFTVSDLADGSGASDATVVRTCKSLGFASFQDFKVSMARNLASPLRTSFSAVAPGDTPEVVVDKIFQENPKYYKHALIDELEKLLGAQIVLIPWDRYEIFGHSDGMVRFISRDCVLLNNYADLDPCLRSRLLQALEPYFYVEELYYDTPRCSRLSWAYLNFLRVKNTIFVPGLHTKEDPLALQQIQQFYPDCKVIQVQGCEELARDGGSLHCVTWNILADPAPKPQEA